MALDELAATIEGIKKHINEFRDSIAANETRTRQVLIDPLLSALGWDVTNPSLVELEYDVRGKRADYALKVDGKPVAVIEAKRLGRQLIDDDTMQVMNYANTEGIDYMVVTNGDQWNMFSVFERGTIEQRVIMELSISGSASHVNALKSLSMWRANLDLDAEPVNANTPVLEGNAMQGWRQSEPPKPPVLQQKSYPNSSTAAIGQSGRGKSIGRRTLDSTKSLSLSGSGWYDLANRAFVPTGKRATAVRIRGEVVETRNFAQAAAEIASWLGTEGFLTREKCPIKSRPTGATYLIAFEPIHEDGRAFRSPKVLPNGMVMEVAASSSDLLMFVRNLVDLCHATSEEIRINWVERS